MNHAKTFKNTQSFAKGCCFLFLVLLLGACGGGGSGGGSTGSSSGGGSSSSSSSSSGGSIDITPDTFHFSSIEKVEPGAQIESEQITITGINTPVSISIA